MTTPYRVIASALNVREEPSVEARVIALFHQGDVVQGLEDSTDRYWVKSASDSVTGWCSRRYLEAIPELPWMKIAEAEMERGVKELPGSQQNERILEYLRSTTLGKGLASQ